MKPYKLLLFCATLNYLLLLTYATTPLCDLCPCNSQPNNPPNVNCVLNNLNDISNKSLWYDNQDKPYEIASLAISFHDVPILDKIFPSSNVKILDLSGNNITQIGESVFGKLQKMEVLILAINRLKHLNPESFKGIYLKNEYYPLRSLKTLNLECNYLLELEEDTFEHIDELEVLILRDNPLYTINRKTVTAIGSLVNLKVLDLSDTKIKQLPNNLLFVSKLNKLDLSGNNFEAIPDSLQDATTLEILIFNNNPIVKLTDDNIFPSVESLQELYMSNMLYLTEIGPGAMSKLANLKNLQIMFNKRLSHIHPHAMVRTVDGKEVGPLLTTALLNNNNLSYIDKEVFFNFDQIERLDISSNPLRCGCRNQWIIDDFLSIEKKYPLGDMVCHSPANMKGKNLKDLYKQQVTLKCLDKNSLTEDTAMLIIGVTAGFLMILITCMYIFITYRQKRVDSPFEYNVLKEMPRTAV